MKHCRTCLNNLDAESETGSTIVSWKGLITYWIVYLVECFVDNRYNYFELVLDVLKSLDLSGRKKASAIVDGRPQ